MKRTALALAIVLWPELASASDSGMFLCRSPVVANDFWNDIMSAQQLGIKLSKEQLSALAGKNACPFIASSTLKPVDFVAGQLAITDGRIKGWASPQLYILCVNRPSQ
jgi:hypothetical protein